MTDENTSVEAPAPIDPTPDAEAARGAVEAALDAVIDGAETDEVQHALAAAMSATNRAADKCHAMQFSLGQIHRAAIWDFTRELAAALERYEREEAKTDEERRAYAKVRALMESINGEVEFSYEVNRLL